MTAYLKNTRVICLIISISLLAIYLTCSAEGGGKSLIKRLKECENLSSMQRYLRDKRTLPHLERAERLMAQKRFEKALKEYDTLLSSDPNNLMVAWDRFLLLVEIASPEAVITAANALLNHVPDGGKILMIRGYSRLKMGDRTGAQQDFEKALRDKTLSEEEVAKAISAQMTLLLYEEEYKKAEKLCKLLIEKDPEKIEYRLVYADLLSRSGVFAEADVQWRQALNLSSEPAMLRRIALSRLETVTSSDAEQIARLINDSSFDKVFLDAPMMERQRYFILLARAAHAQDQLQVDILLMQAMSEVKKKKDTLTQAERQIVLTQLGNAAYDLGRYDLALTTYLMLQEQSLDPTIQVLAAKSAYQVGKYGRVLDLLQDQAFIEMVPSPNLDTLLLLCSAHERRGDKLGALTCFDTAIKRYADVPTLPVEAAKMAGEAGFVELQLDYLLRSYQSKQTAKMAMDIGYLQEHMGYSEGAVNWLKKADELEPSALTGLALAQILLDTNQHRKVISFTEELLSRSSLNAQQAARVYAIRAQAMVVEKRYVQAAEAWGKALARTRRADFNLDRITALRLGGKAEEAREQLASVHPLSSQERVVWLDEKANIEQALYLKQEALATVQQALRIGPNVTRYLQVSMLAMETGDLVESELACLRALQLEPDNLKARRQEIYILEAQGKYAEAARQMEDLLPYLPTDYRLHRALAYFYKLANNNAKALQTYRQAVDMAHKAYQKGGLDRDLLEIKEMQDQSAELDRKLHYSLSVGMRFDDSETFQPTWNSSTETSTHSYTIVELSYRPSVIGYRNGKIAEMYGRLAWAEDGSFTEEDTSPYQAVLGARIQPLKDYNLLMSVESLFSLENLDNVDLQVRLAHSYSNTPWKKFHRGGRHTGGPYIHTFTEAGVGLTDISDYLYNIHGRYGSSTRIEQDNFLSPFVYGTLSGFKGALGSDDHVETGIGVAWDVLADHDRHLGYKKMIDVVFQLGVDLDNDDGSALRGFVGLQFSGF